MDGAVTANYDPARRAWRRTRLGLVGWPRCGSLRSGRVTERGPSTRDASALRSTHYRWPTLLRYDAFVGCGRLRSGSFVIFGTTMPRGWLVPKWCEWHMGFANEWTLR